MTAVATERLIAPHGGALVDRTGDAPDDLDSLEVITLTSRELSDLDMIASGALSPLEGVMGRADYERVVEEMHLANGLPWALPVCLAVDSAPTGDRVPANRPDDPTAICQNVPTNDREACMARENAKRSGASPMSGQSSGSSTTSRISLPMTLSTSAPRIVHAAWFAVRTVRSCSTEITPVDRRARMTARFARSASTAC